MAHYPQLTINLTKLGENVRNVLGLCADNGIDVAVVVKGANGLMPIVNAYRQAGAKTIASSRLEQLEAVRRMWPDQQTLDLRIPMLSELQQMIDCADISLESEVETLAKLDELCVAQHRTHRVILMVDLGDLREGFFKEEDLYAAARQVEDAKGLVLEGIGTNLGCYGSIEPDETNLGRLCELAEHIESVIGRKLAVVSGGASTSLSLLTHHTMPKGINHLRIGDNFLLRDMEYYFDYAIPDLNGDAFTLQAEIIEKKEKPTYPIGHISVDAFGNTPEYVDEGIRTRGLLAIGRQDIGDMTKLHPVDKRIKIYGGSSDHTIIDLTDCDGDYQLGDTVEFTLEYENVLYSTGSPYVHKKYVD
ncbi:alanine/ornithine racemase family PLP-dependent enzyme [Bifidobacterium sp. ESL0763]|uniref:alanine/ornithine racemase family PLP-dependent enzyme n=1 Tax=Bifidobacterium sp. ESL0763 TaxID=2983227 RepID=UPI0023F99E03|nr:alanine/ornithine racemase family PLP-dependent enzyme [Bifidobacterium sp. ESL0763]MDF7663728.1 alanine/ornithine racemase family PLP-dependent enzyme [Bifidobacterium sp. ESL0763]